MTENEGNLTGKMTGTTKSDLKFRHLGMGWDLLWVWSCHCSKDCSLVHPLPYQAQFIDSLALSTFPEAWISLPMITR